MAFPDILIGSKFDAKGFKQAETAVSKLTKNVKFAAGALGLALSARAAVQFGKASLKAFSDDQKAAAQLSNTIKNLGLSFADADIQSFIEKLSLSAGVADDELRPAMQKLLQVTGSVTNSQKLLAQAIDISKGSGVALETVAADLSAAYVGNTKGLKKYSLGLTQAELKTASFDTVMAAFNKNFSGANAAALDTMAGKMALLTVAAGEAQETIGSGLVDAFAILAGDGSFDAFIVKMNTLAENVADFFRGLAIGFRDLANMPVIKQLMQLAGLMLKILGKVAGAVPGVFIDAGRKERNSKNMPAGAAQFLEDQKAAENRKLAAKAEADAKKRNKELLAAQNKQTAELKKQAALKKAQGVFDVQQAGLLAALQGNLTQDEQNRVKALLALQNDNASAATYYTDLVVKAQDKTGALAELLRSLPTAKDPFAAWLISLEKIQASLASINAVGMNPIYNITPASGVESNYGGNFLNATGGYAPVKVDLRVTGDGALTSAIATQLQQSSLSGNQAYIDRRTGGFGG